MQQELKLNKRLFKGLAQKKSKELNLSQKQLKPLLMLYIKDNFSGKNITNFLSKSGFETYDSDPGQRIIFMKYKFNDGFKICIRESFNDDDSFDIELLGG